MNENTMSIPNRQATLSTLRTILAQLVEQHGLTASDIALDDSLIEDLDLDSLKFVDLMGAIEDAMQIAEFPMQNWVDSELERDNKRFTLASLLEACLLELERAQMAEQGPSK